MAEGKELDMIRRDPNQLNGHIKVLFEDVIGEPDGAHSADCVWQWGYKCFTGGKHICYIILTYICAIPMALFWGCAFACISFVHIWHVTPCYRLVAINLECAQRFYAVCINCMWVPCIEAQALIFSKIRVTQVTE